eukprot:g36584.t1
MRYNCCQDCFFFSDFPYLLPSSPNFVKRTMSKRVSMATMAARNMALSPLSIPQESAAMLMGKEGDRPLDPPDLQDDVLDATPDTAGFHFSGHIPRTCGVEECHIQVYAAGFCPMHLPCQEQKLTPTTINRNTYGLWQKTHKTSHGGTHVATWKFVHDGEFHLLMLHHIMSKNKYAVFLNGLPKFSEKAPRRFETWRHNLTIDGAVPLRCLLTVTPKNNRRLSLLGGLDALYQLFLNDLPFEEAEAMFLQELAKKQIKQLHYRHTQVQTEADVHTEVQTEAVSVCVVCCAGTLKHTEVQTEAVSACVMCCAGTLKCRRRRQTGNMCDALCTGTVKHTEVQTEAVSACVMCCAGTLKHTEVRTEAVSAWTIAYSKAQQSASLTQLVVPAAKHSPNTGDVAHAAHHAAVHGAPSSTSEEGAAEQELDKSYQNYTSQYWTKEVVEGRTNAGFKKTIVKWHFTLGGVRHELRLHHSHVSNKRKLLLDQKEVLTDRPGAMAGPTGVYHFKLQARTKLCVLMEHAHRLRNAAKKELGSLAALEQHTHAQAHPSGPDEEHDKVHYDLLIDDVPFDKCTLSIFDLAKLQPHLTRETLDTQLPDTRRRSNTHGASETRVADTSSEQRVSVVEDGPLHSSTSLLALPTRTVQGVTL